MSSPTPSPPDLQLVIKTLLIWSSSGPRVVSAGRSLGGLHAASVLPGGTRGVHSMQIHIDGAVVVRAWHNAEAGMLMRHALGGVGGGQVRSNLDASPHGATGSYEEELEDSGHLLLLPAVDSQDVNNVETTIRPRGGPRCCRHHQPSPTSCNHHRSSPPSDTLFIVTQEVYLATGAEAFPRPSSFGFVVNCPCLLEKVQTHCCHRPVVEETQRVWALVC